MRNINDRHYIFRYLPVIVVGKRFTITTIGIQMQVGDASWQGFSMPVTIIQYMLVTNDEGIFSQKYLQDGQ